MLHLIGSFVGGGTERQLALLAPEHCRLGVDTHVGFLHGGVNLELLRGSPVTLHEIASCGNNDPLILLRLLTLIRACRPHVIQTWLTQMDVFGGLAAKICGVPFVLSERASALAYSGKWKDRLREWVGRRATAIVANSHFGLNYWKTHGTGDKQYMIRNGVPLDRIRATAPADPTFLGMFSNTRLILFAGRLVNPQKNIDLFLEAVSEVLYTAQDVALLLCGEGPLRGHIEEYINRSRFSKRIHFLGFTHDLWRWMRCADVLVSVSRFEGNPNVVLEGMAAGCPLVVSNIPEHREILDETTAQFCRVDGVKDIAAAILETLGNPLAAKARASAAQRRVSAWSIEESARQYLQLYQMLTGRSGVVE